MGDDSSIIKIGPVGRKHGSSWDAKGKTKIVQIFVSHDDEIHSLQFQYIENGALVLSDRFGGSNDGHKFDVVKLNYPVEYITYISGYTSNNHSHLCSITFGTNEGEHGPFGEFTSKDKEFNFWLGKDHQFDGFHGTAGDKKVESIGVYLKPNMASDYYSLNKNVVVQATKEGCESWEMLNGDQEELSPI